MLWMFLAGCMTETGFWSQSATVYCARSEECYKAQFQDQYDDQADCRDDAMDHVDDYQDCYDDNDCDFDPQEAQEYIKDLRTLDCDDLNSADASDVYDGCDQAGLAMCLLGF